MVLFRRPNGFIINNADLDWAMMAEKAWEGYIVDRDGKRVINNELEKEKEEEKKAKEIARKKEISKKFKKALDKKKK